MWDSHTDHYFGMFYALSSAKSTSSNFELVILKNLGMLVKKTENLSAAKTEKIIIELTIENVFYPRTSLHLSQNSVLGIQ